MPLGFGLSAFVVTSPRAKPSSSYRSLILPARIKLDLPLAGPSLPLVTSRPVKYDFVRFLWLRMANADVSSSTYETIPYLTVSLAPSVHSSSRNLAQKPPSGGTKYGPTQRQRDGSRKASMLRSHRLLPPASPHFDSSCGIRTTLTTTSQLQRNRRTCSTIASVLPLQENLS